jgi:hypothetical protein
LGRDARSRHRDDLRRDRGRGGERGEDGRGEILSNIVLSQTEHEPIGGVVPEIAARAHVEALDTIITRAMIDGEPVVQLARRHRGGGRPGS